MSGGFAIIEADVSALSLVGPLFEAMVEHHRVVGGADWPIRDRAEAWERRRQEYEDWLANSNAWLLLALSTPEPTSSAVALGYAFLRVQPPGPTWDLGEEVGEFESLSVSESMRGKGVGTSLIDHCRVILRSRGVKYWSVSVVESNRDAVRLYEREGFRGYYLQLLGAA